MALSLYTYTYVDVYLSFLFYVYVYMYRSVGHYDRKMISFAVSIGFPFYPILFFDISMSLYLRVFFFFS